MNKAQGTVIIMLAAFTLHTRQDKVYIHYIYIQHLTVILTD